MNARDLQLVETPTPENVCSTPATNHQKRRWPEVARASFIYYYLATLVVFNGAWFGTDFLQRRNHPNGNEPGYISSLAAWDGAWYERIARDGYFYDPSRESSVAFFPAFPLLARVVAAATGMPVEWALLAVAHGCLIGTFILLAAYVRARWPDGPAELADWTLLAFGFWPLTFFFRMAYSESTFLFFALLAMYGMVRRWPAWGVALAVGAGTAARPVGVALLVPFALYLWQREGEAPSEPGRQPIVFPKNPGGSLALPAVARCVLWGGLACWGIVAYMGYQYAAFGDPLAFVHTQEDWATHPGGTFWSRALAALSLEPILAKYDPASASYWATHDPHANPLFSVDFLNPLCFLLTAATVAYGVWKGWLDKREWTLAAVLLLIPYLTHSHRSMMMAHARYAAVAFPFYLVLGRLLCRAPVPLSAGLLGCSAFLLGAYAALFASWHRFF